MTTLEISFAEADALLAFVEQQLAKGMVFLADRGGVEPLTPCALVVSMHGRSVTLRAEIVYVRDDGPGKGVGLQLAPPDAATLATIRALTEPAPLPLPMPEALVTDGAPDLARESAALVERDEPDEPDDEVARSPHLHERLRSLSSAEQQKLATTGTLAERTMLERLYGPNVWESLLSGGRATPPEVARIARIGTLPLPLLELIGGNGAWIASPLVQRALLSNPRCPTTVVSRVLQALSRRDLMLVPQQAAYPASVRQAAKALLGR
ncbi:MAG: hypothetical protein K1X94_18150 [Sandaracinaceae bacterium]|nr:hypothetical protein [Sandaracinaceae bacterium]